MPLDTSILPSGFNVLKAMRILAILQVIPAPNMLEHIIMYLTMRDIVAFPQAYAQFFFLGGISASLITHNNIDRPNSVRAAVQKLFADLGYPEFTTLRVDANINADIVARRAYYIGVIPLLGFIEYRFNRLL